MDGRWRRCLRSRADVFRQTIPTALFTAIACAAAGCGAPSDGLVTPLTLLNVSYDPTRELYRDINEAFARRYGEEHGRAVEIKQSHAASGSQARAVIDGLEADVVTLAVWPDVEAVAKAGLVKGDWQARFDNAAVPYHSVVVFVVRKGNPKGIRDWPDLVRNDVSIITPNPKTSGNGKYSFLAAWGSVITAGGTEQDAERFVAELYRRTPVLDTGARAATATFSQKGIGDVHLTFENEAHLEVAEAGGELEIVYPSRSIRVDPPVAVVDANVDRRGTRHAAEAYLGFLYTPEGRAIIAKHHYRPWGDDSPNPPGGATWPAVEMFDITAVGGWQTAMTKFFGEDGVFDQIYVAQAGR
ncbi:MAG: sulfate ABC transporter substrate-binding protein [Planctomycetia bacterium]|nr:sulfate ABC transporter substrate-binding protein [Planctomycetia bacterium]